VPTVECVRTMSDLTIGTLEREKFVLEVILPCITTTASVGAADRKVSLPTIPKTRFEPP